MKQKPKFKVGDLVHITERDFIRNPDNIHLVLSSHDHLRGRCIEPAVDDMSFYYTLLNQATGRKIKIVERYVTSTEDYWNRKTYFEEDYRSLP